MILPSDEEKRTIEQFVVKVCMPILVDVEGVYKLLANGTPFEISDRHFIVTADHIFDEIHDDVGLIRLPQSPSMERFLPVLPVDIVWRTRSLVYDVALI